MKVNYTLSNFIAFAAGAAIGSLIAWKISKSRYEQLMEKETEELRKYYNNKFAESKEEDSCEVDEEELEDYKEKLEKFGYVNYSNSSEKTGVDDTDKPYVIKPEDFGSIDEYEKVSLTYYSDGILADELDFVIEDVEDAVGKDSLNHFGEYEDDSVFVRNDRLECDYEILRDSRKYVDVVGPTEPHGVG
jgi:hypothetical protein